MKFNDWYEMKKAMHDPPLDDADVARALGENVSRSTPARWARGEALPKREHVAGLALLFKVSPTTIMRMTDNAALQEEAHNEEGQQAIAALLAHAPELGEFMQIVWKLPTDKRAALILIARAMAAQSS